MAEYNNILQESSSKIIELRKPSIAISKESIPKIYNVIIKENFGLTPYEASQRIEKDCSAKLLNQSLEE